MPYRVNGQYIMEGLASSFMFTLGGLGFIVLDQVTFRFFIHLFSLSICLSLHLCLSLSLSLSRRTE